MTSLFRDIKRCFNVISAMACVVALLSVSATAATFSNGYSIGSGLLGPTLVDGADHAGLGTFDLRANDTGNGNGTYGWVAVWDDLWSVGDDVSVTGISLPLRSPNTGTANNTSNGTFTFTFYELSGGGNANGWDGINNGETVLGTADVVFSDAGSAPAILPYATFDSPIDFTSSSTGIAVHVNSTGSIRTRWDDNADGVDGIHENRFNGNDTTRGHQWTIAGSVISTSLAATDSGRIRTDGPDQQVGNANNEGRAVRAGTNGGDAVFDGFIIFDTSSFAGDVGTATLNWDSLSAIPPTCSFTACRHPRALMSKSASASATKQRHWVHRVVRL